MDCQELALAGIDKTEHTHAQRGRKTKKSHSLSAPCWFGGPWWRLGVTATPFSSFFVVHCMRRRRRR